MTTKLFELFGLYIAIAFFISMLGILVGGWLRHRAQIKAIDRISDVDMQMLAAKKRRWK